MSTTIDEKVVELRFDNSNFEKNVQTSINTLEKLKQSTKLDGATEGFQNLEKAANSIDLSGIASGVAALEQRFSTMGIVSMRVIQNLTDSVMGLASKMTSFVKNSIISGGIRRAMNIENAHFQLQGLLKDEEAVQAVMQDAMDSVDGTAYAYDSAAKAASQFAASGMRAGEQMQSALRAITGVAAMTNAEYEDISRIFTTVSGNGRLMGEQLLQLSSRGLNAAATLADYLHISESEVREMVSKGEISFETFASAMDDAFGEHAKKANETFTGSMSNIKAALARIGADFISPLVVQNGPLVNLFNTIRERVNDLRKAVQPSATVFVNCVTKMANAATTLLKSLTPNSKWNEFTEKIESAGISVKEFETKLKETAKENGIAIDEIIKKEGSLANAFKHGSLSSSLIIDTLKEFVGLSEESSKATEEMTKKLEYFQKVVDDVWYGTYGNDDDRVKALAEAGYDYYEVQELVNKTKDKHRLTLEDLNETQLKSIGYTEDEIKAIKELAEEAEKTGAPLNELIESLNKPTKGELVIETFSNVLSGIKTTLKSIGTAWKEIFTNDNSASESVLYTFLETLHELSTHFVISEEGADKLTRTLKGLFAILDLISTVTRTGLRIGLEVIQEVLKAIGFVNIDILSITATIGDAIVTFRDWVKQHDLISKAIQAVIPLMVKFAQAIADLLKKLYELPAIQNGISKVTNGLKDLYSTVSGFLGGGLERFSEFLDHLKEIDKLDLDNVKLILKDFKETVIDYFFDFDKIFSGVGENIVRGLCNGLQNGAGWVLESIINIGRNLITGICDLLGIHSPSTVFFDIGENIIQGLINGIKSGLSLISDAVGDIFSKMAEAFNKIDFDKLVVVGTIAGVLVTLNKMVNAYSEMVKTIGKFAAPLKGFNEVMDTVKNSIKQLTKDKSREIKSQSILNIAKAIGILAASLVVLSLMDQEKLWSAVGAISALTAVMFGLFKLMEKVDKTKVPDIGKVSLLMIGLGASVLLLSSALKKISGIENLIGSLLGIAALIGGLLAVMLVYSKFIDAGASVNIDKAGAMMLKMSIAIGVLAVVLKAISSIEDPSKGIDIIYKLGLLFVGLMAVFKLTGGSTAGMDKAGTMMLKMSVAIGILAGVMKLINTMTQNEIDTATKTIGTLEGFFALFVAVFKLSGGSAKDVDKAGSMMLKMGAAVGILAIAIKLIATISEWDIAKGIATIGSIEILFAIFIDMAKNVGKDADKAATILLKMSGAILVLTMTMKLIAGMSIGDITKGLMVIGLVETLFAGVIFVSKFAGQYAARAGTMLLKMSAAIMILVGAIALLSFLNQEDIDKGLKFIAGVEVLLSAIIYVSKFAGKNADKAGTMLLKMTVPIIALVAAIAILSQLDPGRVAVASLAITAVVGMFALLVAATSMAKKATGTILLLTGVVAVLAGILYILAGLEVESVLGTAASISMLLLSLSASCAILSIAGTAAPAALAGIGVLAALIVAVGTLMTAIGALVTYIPEIETFLDKGITVLCMIGEGLGMFFGKIAAGFIEGVSSALPQIAEDLSAFMSNLQTFIEGAKQINPSVATGMKSLAETILILTAAEILDGITNWITGGVSLTEFANELVPFGEAMVAFSEVVSGNIDATAVQAAANAGKIMAEMQATIPGSGGVLQFFSGEHDMITFANDLTLFGNAITSFSEKVSGNIDEDAVLAAANAGKIMTEFQSTLPNSGGVVQFFTGEKNLGTFSERIIAFGEAIATFSDKVAGNINEDAITAAKNAGLIMVELQNALPKDGGWWIFDNGDMNLDEFGELLADFGEGLKRFYGEVSELNAEQLTAICKGVDSLVDVIKGMSNLDDSGAKSFKSAIDTLAETNIAGFVSTFDGSSNGLSSIGESMVNLIANGIESSKNLVVNATSTLVTAMANNFDDKKSKFNTIGEKLIKELASGIKESSKNAKTSMSNALDAIVDEVKSYYNEFYDAGGYIVAGFANGISNNAYLATAKATAMASAAATAARRALNEHSPSKVFYKIGDYAGLGFVNALDAYASKSYDAGLAMADSARNGLNNAIWKVKDYIDTGIDTQPTIRPVLDLSDIESNAGTISNMFNGLTPSVDVLSNVGTISSMMNRNQNGSNDNVVSAINRLRKEMGGTRGDTYNINGVTYDDGSNVSNAVKDLIRAINTERRS